MSTQKKLSEEILFEESFQRLEAERLAIPSDKVILVNLDVPQATSTAFAVVPILESYREQIVKRLPDFDITRFDKIEEYARGLSHANVLYSMATNPPDDLKSVYEAGLHLREIFHADIVSLTARGFIHVNAIRDYKGLVGYRNVATELQLLATVLKASSVVTEGKCATSSEEIERALQIVARLLRVAGERELSPAAVASATDTRNRAFTLFTNAYDDARRAIIYLRWHEGDASEIIPSLYAGRGGTKKKSAVEEKVPAPVASGVQTNVPDAASKDTTVTSANISGVKSRTNTAENGPFMV
jgi:hypothetical protein